jgi:hypothetical protein
MHNLVTFAVVRAAIYMQTEVSDRVWMTGAAVKPACANPLGAKAGVITKKITNYYSMKMLVVSRWAS